MKCTKGKEPDFLGNCEILIFKFFFFSVVLFQISTPVRQIGSSARTTVAFPCVGCVTATTTAATMKTNPTTLV